MHSPCSLSAVTKINPVCIFLHYTSFKTVLFYPWIYSDLNVSAFHLEGGIFNIIEIQYKRLPLGKDVPSELFRENLIFSDLMKKKSLNH